MSDLTKTNQPNYFGPDLSIADFPDRIGANRAFWFYKLCAKLNKYAAVLRNFDGTRWGASKSTAISASSGGWTLITLDALTDSTYGPITSNGFLIPVSGTFMIWGSVGWAANASGRRGAAIARNGTLVPASFAWDYAADGTDTVWAATVPVLYSFNAGDLVQLFGYQDSGAALNTASCWMQVRKAA